MWSYQISNETHGHLSEQIADWYQESAKARGTGIARRSPEYIKQKIVNGHGFLVFREDTNHSDTKKMQLAGFCYVEVWNDGAFLANSGLIISEKYRGFGLGFDLKQFAFKNSRKLFPKAKLFGLTTSQQVMSINSDLGYRPVTFGNLTKDQKFWQACRSCVNYPVLSKKNFSNCLCTAMLFDPAREINKAENKQISLKEETGSCP